MTFDDACTRLTDLLSSPSFEAGRIFDAAEVAEHERAIGVTFPEAHRTFMQRVGAARLFLDERGRGIDVVAIDALREFSRSVFDGYADDPFPAIVLVVSLPRLGAWGGFVTDRPTGENFALFWPDDDPDDWARDATYGSFEEWIVQVVESNGDKVIL